MSMIPLQTSFPKKKNMVEGADSGVEIWVLHGDEKRGLVYQASFFIRKKLPVAGSVGIKMIYLYGRISSV